MSFFQIFTILGVIRSMSNVSEELILEGAGQPVRARHQPVKLETAHGRIADHGLHVRQFACA